MGRLFFQYILPFQNFCWNLQKRFAVRNSSDKMQEDSVRPKVDIQNMFSEVHRQSACSFLLISKRLTNFVVLVTESLSAAYIYKEMRQLQFWSILEWLYSKLFFFF